MSKPKLNSLKRSSMLKHTAEIQELFNKGKRNDYEVFYTISNISPACIGDVKVLFTVPKRHVRKAVSRNVLKRKMREALRKNFFELKECAKEKKLEIHLGFVYSKNYILAYSEMEEKIILSLQNLMKNIINQY